MKSYKKYGDIYKTTAQVRKLLKNKPYANSDGLRDFWLERIIDLLDVKPNSNLDLIARYCVMFHLSYVIEKNDILSNWKRAVFVHRLQYRDCKP